MNGAEGLRRTYRTRSGSVQWIAVAEDLADPETLALAVCEAAPDAILLVRESGEIAIANRMAEKTFGYTRAELIGQPIEMLVPEAQRPGHRAHRARFEKTDKVREMGGLAPLEAVRKNGELVPVEISLSPVDLPGGRVTIAIVRDVTARRRLEEQLRFASTHDSLTDLFNRAHFESIRPRLGSAAPIGVVMLDVDGLKRVNDELGHEAGDQLLQFCGVVLRAATVEPAMAVRLGGDEFAILIPNATSATVRETVERVREELDRHNELRRGPKLRLSIGSSLSDKNGGIRLAMRLADRRMYEAKRRHGLAR